MAEADQIMNRHEFEDLVDTYGGWLQSWPKDERARAEHFLKDHPEAEESLEELRSVERVLAGSRYESGPEVEGGDYTSLVDTIMAGVEEIDQDGLGCANDLSVSQDLEEEAKSRQQPRKQGLPAMLMAGVLAASLLLGVFAGGGLSFLGMQWSQPLSAESQSAGGEDSFSILDYFGL